MDLGCSLSTDGLVPVSSDPNVLIPSFFPLDSEPSKQRGLFQSSFSKHGRSVVVEEDDEYWTRLKTARGDPMLTSTSKAATCLLGSGSHSLFPDGEQMLNFSSWKSDALVLNNHWNSPSFNHPSSSSAYPTFRNAACSGNPTLNIQGAVSEISGPFTTSQWSELEQQTLIYKYIDAKVPLPSNLLLSIRRSINPSGLSSFIAGTYRPAGTLGWGNFHLGLAGSADPEPGRCRRTDGKKWRCSRDAVVDQKYCERHMNRGRHRSRKRVEGHNGHAAKAAVPAAITSSQSASALSSGGSSNNLAVAQQQSKNIQPSFTEPSSLQLDRLLMNRDNTNVQRQDAKGLSVLTDVNSKSTGTLLPMSKQLNPFEETSTRVDLGLVSTDSVLNNEGNCSSENLSFVFYHSEMNDQHTRSHPFPFRHFIDDWSKTPSDGMEKKQSNRTELSISIPISSSANQDKLSFSPLRLSCEFNPTNDGTQRGLSWIPISWEPNIGGPLGEVLTNTSSTTPKDLSSNLSASSLNLMTDGWNSKARFESSPTGVLQESGFGSLSSSAGSSPRAENHKAHESDDLLGSTFVNLSTNPSL
ncbi:growth-regulating factor 6-like isoform X2 [Phalaenopsis equestris]|uniref:growth-regulating factor 6-like isoform X2 n=1 Tax=Phalaenopsis equestris TaxID=78828 RepID=UPI0009E636D6|nr:growth-regulating factor 6-like isoform X2 [Phalaenopsis equestris]